MISTKTIGKRVQRSLESVGFSVTVNTTDDCLRIYSGNSNYIALLDTYRTVTEAEHDIVSKFKEASLNTSNRNSGDIDSTMIFPRIVKRKTAGRVYGVWNDLYVEFYYVIDGIRHYVTQNRMKLLGETEISLATLAFYNVDRFIIKTQLFSAKELGALMQLPDNYDASSFLCSTIFLEFLDKYYKNDVKLLPMDNVLIIDPSDDNDVKKVKKYLSKSADDIPILGAFAFKHETKSIVTI